MKSDTSPALREAVRAAAQPSNFSHLLSSYVDRFITKTSEFSRSWGGTRFCEAVNATAQSMISRRDAGKIVPIHMDVNRLSALLEGEPPTEQELLAIGVTLQAPPVGLTAEYYPGFINAGRNAIQAEKERVERVRQEQIRAEQEAQQKEGERRNAATQLLLERQLKDRKNLQNRASAFARRQKKEAEQQQEDAVQSVAQKQQAMEQHWREAFEQQEEQRKALFPKVRHEFNPEGLEEQPSFIEMIEASAAAGENFKQFMFGRVLPQWGKNGEKMTAGQFCKHLEALNERHRDVAKKTLNVNTFYGWEDERAKPLRDSVKVMLEAFEIKPQPGELMAMHERLLWKIINGHELTHGELKGDEAIDALVQLARDTGDSGPLAWKLFDAAGIRYERLREFPQFDQLPAWTRSQLLTKDDCGGAINTHSTEPDQAADQTPDADEPEAAGPDETHKANGKKRSWLKRGAKIPNLDTAMQFLSLVHPEPLPVGVMSDRHRSLLSVLSGREFDLDKITDEARKAGNPGGALMTALASRTGLVQLSTEQILDAINVDDDVKDADQTISESQLHKMRGGNKLARGGKIYEPQAKAYIALVESAANDLVGRGICKPFTEALKEEWIELMTGVPHPRQMLSECLTGKRDIRDMIRDTCERKGLNLQGDKGFYDQVGIGNLSRFLSTSDGEKHWLEPETARKVAQWYEDHYQFDGRERKELISLLRGNDLLKSADAIVLEANVDRSKRGEKLGELYDRAGTRAELAEKARVSPHTINYSMQEVSGYRIVASPEVTQRIARAVGISDECYEMFLDLYSAARVARAEIVRAERKPDAPVTSNRRT